MEIKKGNKVAVLPINGRSYENKEPFEAEIISAGSKFFKVSGIDSKFRKDDLSQVTDYSTRFKIYPSLQEIFEEKEFNENTQKIRQFFNGWGKVKLTNEDLKKIISIIENTTAQ